MATRMLCWCAGLLAAIGACLAIAGPAAGQAKDELNELNRQVAALQSAGKYAEAVPLAERALAMAEEKFGADHAMAAARLNVLGSLHISLGRYAQAEPLLKRAITIREKTPGPQSAELAQSLGELGIAYRHMARYAEAEALTRRSVAIYEKNGSQAALGVSLGNLAEILRRLGRFAEAEPLYRRALVVHEQALGPEHRNVATTLSNLASMLADQNRRPEAQPLYERALAIYEKALGPNHPTVAITLGNLALNLSRQRRYAEAEPLFKRSLSMLEASLGPQHPYVAVNVITQAEMLRSQGQVAEAEQLYRKGLAIQEKVYGPDHPEIATALGHIGFTLQLQKRYAEAEPLFARGLAIREAMLGPDHRLVGTALNTLANNAFEQQDWTKATALLQRSTDLAVRRHKRDGESLGRELTAHTASEAALQAGAFIRLVKAAYRVGAADKARFPDLARQMFQTAQWAKSSETAASLAQMSVRQASGDTGLARLVRERQDLVGEWRVRDAALLAAATEPPARRNRDTETGLRTRLSAIDARIKEIDQALASGFPQYAALANPEPLSIADVQAQLKANEALIFFLDTGEMRPLPEETFLWAVTKTSWRSFSLERGTRAGLGRIATLRCGLDRIAWEGEGAARCAAHLKLSLSAADLDAGKPLPFNLASAHDLYRGLFGRIEPLIKDKDLLIVPTGPLTALPFHVLVTEKPANAYPETAADYENAAWLIKRHAITVLPSVASLKALRQFAKASQATRPFIGFGNPLLLGPTGTDRRAWERQACGTAPSAVQVASRSSVHATIPKFFRGGLADVAEVRAQYPLPETADELCAVARLSQSQDGAVYLGAKATEATIKALSADGTLAQARVVHFATHGLVAGETELLMASKAEPALILTPPATATEEDDGLLTASEVAQLKLDADWVVLSACNTAAGVTDRPGAEPMSGLARAFFYAGARGLLVSHWAVDSEATVKLVTKAFDELKADAKLGRAEALRRSMLALSSSGGRNAHPATWAPFVVVGEGGS